MKVPLVLFCFVFLELSTCSLALLRDGDRGSSIQGPLSLWMLVCNLGASEHYQKLLSAEARDESPVLESQEKLWTKPSPEFFIELEAHGEHHGGRCPRPWEFTPGV